MFETFSCAEAEKVRFPANTWEPQWVEFIDKSIIALCFCEFPCLQSSSPTFHSWSIQGIIWKVAGVGFQWKLWSVRNDYNDYDSYSFLKHPLLFCAAVLNFLWSYLSMLIEALCSLANGPRLLSCFSLSSCPLFYTISVSSFSVFFLVVSCSITLLSACKSLSALHPGLCQHLDLSHLWNKAVAWRPENQAC